jgi:hypothetical protein
MERIAEVGGWRFNWCEGCALALGNVGGEWIDRWMGVEESGKQRQFADKSWGAIGCRTACSSCELWSTTVCWRLDGLRRCCKSSINLYTTHWADGPQLLRLAVVVRWHRNGRRTWPHWSMQG